MRRELDGIGKEKLFDKLCTEAENKLLVYKSGTPLIAKLANESRPQLIVSHKKTAPFRCCLKMPIKLNKA